MSDHEPTPRSDDQPDDELDRRLRAGLSALVADGPEAPPMPEPGVGPGRPHARRGPVLVLVAAAIVGLVLLAVVVTREVPGREDRVVAATGSAAPPTARGPDRTLIGTDWELESARDGRGELEVTSQLRFVPPISCVPGELCLEPLTIAGSIDCNSFGGDVEINDGLVTLSEVSSTLVGCAGDNISSVFADSFRYRIEGDLLTVTGGDDVVLIYRGTEPAAAAPDETVLLEAAHDEGRVRWAVREEGTDVIASVTYLAPGTPADPRPTTLTISDTPVIEAVKKASAGVDDFIFGFVVAGTTTVTYQAGDADPVPLEVQPVEGLSEVVAFGGYVPAGEDTYSYVATDAAGRELESVNRQP